MPVQTQILTRRGTAASWTSTNPTLGAGEIGYETDTGRFKIGTGAAAWASLGYFNRDPLTTKGDLYTFSTTDDRLAVGANGESLVADSSAATGLRYQNNFAAGKNKIINGDFYVNQRAFTSNTTAIYGFDRWAQAFSGGTSVTNSAQTFTLGAAPVAGYEGKNFNRQVTVGQSGANDFAQIIQRIESVRTLANQTATISFYAKAATGTPKISVEFQQVFGTGGSPSAATLTDAGQVTITTSWVRYSVTVNVPSIAGKTLGTNNDDYLTLALWTSSGSTYNARTGSMGIQNNTFDFWGVQVEAGSVATAFQTATGTIQGELAACQRYLPAFRGEYSPLNGWFTSTTGGNWVYNFAVPARVAPTGITISAVGDFQLVNKAIAAVSPTAITWNYGGTSTASVSTTHTAGSPTSAQGEVGFLRASTSSAYILFTGCEL